MNLESNLEHEITSGLTELRGLLEPCSTSSVAGHCFSYYLCIANGTKPEHRLSSPAKQLAFLLAVLLSGQEPESPVQLGEEEWGRVTSILNRLFFAYMSLYMPSAKEYGNLTSEWHRVREVAMLAFLHYFNTSLLASVEQVEERVKTYLAPFDEEISAALGISASQTITICQWIGEQVQKSLDDLQALRQAESEERHKLLNMAEKESWSFNGPKDATWSSSYPKKAKKLFSGLNDLGFVSLPNLEVAFPGIAGTFWDQFSVQRGEAPEIRYPTEQSIFEKRPLIRITGTKAFCPSINALFNAVLFVGERTLLQSRARDKFLRSRDKTLEDETLKKIKTFLSPKASIWSGVYETPDSQYEHDVVVVDNGLYLLIEAKAAPPREPFRDPDKAFVRLRDAFRSDMGIQKAYEQSNRIVKKLKVGKVVPLYDKGGHEVGCLQADKSKLPVGVCVTRDNYGSLATNLSLLLEKDTGDSYPWAVNIIDLGNLAEAWSYFGWGPVEFRKYLEQRILLHGKVFADDELDYAGYFMRHGSFDSVIKARADLLQLNPEYSSIFDDLYRHLHVGGPPVTLEQTEPVLTDFKRSLALGRPVFIDNEENAPRGKKIGRNEPCPCGSGKKYKRCCGANR